MQFLNLPIIWDVVDDTVVVVVEIVEIVDVVDIPCSMT